MTSRCLGWHCKGLTNILRLFFNFSNYRLLTTVKTFPLRWCWFRTIDWSVKFGYARQITEDQCGSSIDYCRFSRNSGTVEDVHGLKVNLPESLRHLWIYTHIGNIQKKLPTVCVTGFWVNLPLYKSWFTPPRNNSESNVVSLKPNSGSVGWFCAMRLWKTGSVLKFASSGKAIPISPSGRNCFKVKPLEYRVAAPIVCPVACEFLLNPKSSHSFLQWHAPLILL